MARPYFTEENSQRSGAEGESDPEKQTQSDGGFNPYSRNS